ncbi:MAG: efflux RND transporter permease subunit [Candidatus Aminicenantes bacterium]|nr:efflux RND transporter permease subunit [Candidatus Aminicenantes bacterium]
MKIFIERPIATAMIFMALLVLGVYSFLNIPIELAPKEDFPQLDIRTSWSGVSPEIVQTQITSPLEEAVSTVRGVQKITSESHIGRSRITLEFEEDTNMEFAHLALREKISGLKDVLPYGIRPWVEPYVPDDFTITPLLQYTISGDYSLQALREMVKDKLEIGIGAIKGISGVYVTGGSDAEIKVILDNEKIKALNIHPYSVSYFIQQRTRSFPAGKAKKGNQEFVFRYADPINGVKELGETILTFSGGNPIKIKDIARIIPSFGEIYQVNRINGKPTISLTIRKEKGISTLKLTREVKKKLEDLKKELPPDLIFRIVDDESEEIQKNLDDLYLLVAIIIVIIFILVLLVLRRVRPTLLVLSSLAFSVLITFNLIYFFKISLNMLTLGGLTLGFGLFVDNSIVVFENVLRKREEGFQPVQAAIQGAKEVFLPVLAATLTTISVFFSFAYFQGRLKIYYFPLAVAISLALTASLLVSFSLIPALSPRFLKKPRKMRKEKFRGWYEKTLKLLLKHPLEVILILIFIFIGSYKWFRSEVSLGEWFSWYSKEMLGVYLGLPPGSPIEEMDKVVHKFEEKVLEKPYEKEMNTNFSGETAYIRISFPPEIEFSYHPYVLKEELIQLATNFAGISVSIYGFDPQGYSSSITSGPYYSSRIKFYGYNLKKLQEITSALERTLKRNPRIKDVRISSSRWGWRWLDSFEYVLKLDKEKLRKFNIDPAYLHQYIQALIAGNVMSRPIKAKITGEELNVAIKFPESDDMDLKELQKSLIRTRNGEYLRLEEITTLEEKPIAGSIDREDQRFQQTVMWEFRGPAKAEERYRKSIFEKLELPPGFSATMEDDRFMTTEEKQQLLFAIIFSLIVIYMILSSLYESLVQPFFILLAVPLALIGVFIAFIVADFPFDSSAYIGVILLGGIVVNNSILLVDHMNLKRKEGLELRDAVLKGARERIRPIFMTTSTTVLGMFPLILIQLEEGRRQIWSSLVLSAIGGLISSTLFILIIIPVLYYYGDGLRSFFNQRILEVRKAWKQF